MTVQIIGQEVEPSLSWAGMTAALEAGHLRPRAEIRDMVLQRDGDTLLNRAAWIDGLGQLVKVATVFPGNGGLGLPSVNGAVTLFDDKTGVLTALVDFHLVTKWKTAGDSLLSARRLARKDSRRILLVGAGTVARSMVSAYASVFPQAEFTVWSRSRASAEAMDLPVAEDLEQAVKAADIICTCTMSQDSLVLGAWLQPGQHLDLIGAYTAAMREVDDEAMARARVFVDSRATTIGHIGELIEPMKSGAMSEADVIADFYDDPAFYSRRSEDEITIAKNGGGAHLDLMTADYIAKMA
ncbi:ornithine cyclodeaminase family protein [Pseudotabrizicola alkalilacus]|uniref:Ornithine cyclodeaminase n=1 Tax=Pseudotabrizicola alkalilacus TaxID=2305252 RepID=A0A411Z4Y9_9RHOB|nr:ornithine cyclodeaminase [Pseudotabrizicola alkalilacus]RGP38125.1 ornithine cyclodeaminase [Pseudotabrizicola alkalilacus]